MVWITIINFLSPQLWPSPTQADEELSFQIMDRFAELGGNFLDTANVYGRGTSETVVGNWLAKYV